MKTKFLMSSTICLMLLTVACSTYAPTGNTPAPTNASPAQPRESPQPTTENSQLKTAMTYEYYQDQKGEWRWRLKAANNRIIADSGEGYSTEQACKDDIARVKNSKDAPVVQKK